MRAELNRIERILAYLDGEMKYEDKIAFDKEMSTDNSLKSDVNDFQMLISGFKNQVLKNEITEAKQQFRKAKLIQKLLIIVGILAVIASVALIFNYFKQQQKEAPSLTANSSIIINDSLGNDRVGIVQLPIQTFELNTKINNVIETREGIVIAIGANSFNSSSSKVTLKVQEALKPSDIILSGLSTTYKDSLLETSGMFVIEAFEGDKKLDLTKEIIVEVPVLSENEDYRLFDGILSEDGQVTWTNPQPLEYYLQTFNVTSLNFYPQIFEPTLAKEINGSLSKEIKDSIYYSLEPIQPEFNVDPKISSQKLDVIRDIEPSAEQKRAITPPKPDTTRVPYEIDIIRPSQIKAIWNERFNNTIIATKEFEERLGVLHKLCGVSDDFDAIITPLTNDIEELDRRIMKYYGQKALQSIETKKKGVVRPNEGLQAELNRYYAKKQREFAQQARSSIEKKFKEQALRQAYIDSLTTRVYKVRSKNASTNFQYELDRTLHYLSKELDFPYPTPPTLATANVRRVSARVNTLGPKNIDRIVIEGLMNRKDINAANRSNKKRAQVQMREFNLDLSAYSKLKCEVFLIPDSLQTYIRLNNNKNIYTYSLNELLSYKLVVIATDGTKYYYAEQGKVPSGRLSVELKEKELKAIKAKLDEGNKGPIFQSEQMFQELKLQTETLAFRNSKLSQSLALRERLVSALYPCMYQIEGIQELE